MKDHREANFDGLIGPTHNYAGLALGNVASAKNAGSVSNPKAAALQGLAKMRVMTGLGCVQGFLPPLARPDLKKLRALGFSGTDRQIVEKAAKTAPSLLANVYSASSMWTANAATVAPSPDTRDGKIHFTPANLASNFHRAIEAEATASALRHVFPHAEHFAHHPPLPGGVHFGDEGAANHGRLAEEHGERGVHLFVYGENGEQFPARQTRRAGEAVARNHGLAADKTVFVKQARAALDTGAFHNDVVGVANECVLFLHEQSFEDREGALAAIRTAAPFVEIVEADKHQVPLEDAISSYLFNSQLVSIDGGGMALILPQEAEENAHAKAFIDETVSTDNPINRAVFMNVRESMRNGGGPACLRLRIVLAEKERCAVNQNFLLDVEKIAALEAWAQEHYRDRLALDDLKDPAFLEEAFIALDALTGLLDMGAFYDFQN